MPINVCVFLLSQGNNIKEKNYNRVLIVHKSVISQNENMHLHLLKSIKMLSAYVVIPCGICEKRQWIGSVFCFNALHSWKKVMILWICPSLDTFCGMQIIRIAAYSRCSRCCNDILFCCCSCCQGNAAGGICERGTRFRDGKKKNLNTGVVTFINYGKKVSQKVSQITFAHETGHNFGSPVSNNSLLWELASQFALLPNWELVPA